MSTLAAARADNFYYAPGSTTLPKLQKSNKFKDRVRNGALVIRFEMPFKVFCNNCDEIIAKGVRFNAEKRCVGNYFSTKIYEFSMRCNHCSNLIKIETDPKNADYKVTLGIRKKIESFLASDANVIEIKSLEERAKIEKDAILKLELAKEENYGAKELTDTERINQLYLLNDSRGLNDYKLNRSLRKKNRELQIFEEEEKKKINNNFTIPLLKLTARDVEEASSIQYRKKSSKLRRYIRTNLAAHSRIFKTPSRPSTAVMVSTKPSKKLYIQDPLCEHVIFVHEDKPIPVSTPQESDMHRRKRLLKEWVRIKAERKFIKS